jgi:hypothetical protein
VDIITQLAKDWGPPAIIAIIMWLMLQKSEQREAKKDTRIQLLENLLIESYDERISAAGQIAEALHVSANSISALTHEIRERR